MQRNIRWTWIAMLAGFVVFFGNIQYARSAPPGAADSGESIGYLENITFEKLKNKERVTISVSKPSKASIDSVADNGVLVKMENIFIPEELRRSIGEGKLTNMIRVLPVQKAIDGAQWAIISIDLREKVPYSVSQQGPNVVIDFNVATLEGKQIVASQTSSPPPVMEGAVKNGQVPTGGQVAQEGDKKQSAGKMISLDFQEAKIKAVLRLLAETGGVSIVSGDDVPDKNITIHMKKVPWEQALDTILEVNGLAKKQMGDVISVVTLKKMKEDEADRRQGEVDRAKAESTAREMEQKRLAERGKLRQISIEAKIVEATDNFVRNLGIKWGGVTYQTVGNTPYAVTVGTNTTTSGAAVSYKYPSGIPEFSSSAQSATAVNLPALIASPAIGLIIGGASGVLEAQLAALETTNQGKIISSPRITTMDNVKATIKQGQQIPVVTPATTSAPATVTFKDALLQLEVKPRITDEGKISMEIKASKDSPNYSQAIQGNYPIDTNMVESHVVIGDGETIVIGGVENKTESKGEDGVPWLSKLPVLGWLFKSEATKKEGRKLMIFVTPRIIKDDAVEKISKETAG